MNAEELKRLTLIKSLVEEQGADGDKRWLISRLEAAEATCQSLLEQSSRWEAQALEAGVRIAELEAQVGAAREVLEVADLRGDTDLPNPADDLKPWTARMRTAWEGLRVILARADAALAGEPGERSYSAEEMREAFAAGIRYYCLKGGVGAADEARRRYPEKPQEGKGA
jgi:hypothetical protein